MDLHPPTPAPARVSPKSKNDMEATDRAKEREFYRYYNHPKQDTVGSDQTTPVAEPVRTDSDPPSQPLDPPRPLPAEDKVLLSLAQLGALRLNVRRCVISFFDRKSSFVLAEATRTLSLDTFEPSFEEDKICWGACVFPKEFAICNVQVNLPLDPVNPNVMPPLVVNDLSLDDRFKHFPSVAGPPYSRFYAGVPIRSPIGHRIGSYCVLDERVRDGITPLELSFMREMAACVMKHLELTRRADDHRLRGLMVKSLGTFAEGKASLQEWWYHSWEPEPVSGSMDGPTASEQRRPASSSSAPRPQLSETINDLRKDSIESSSTSARSTYPTSPASVAPTEGTVMTPASEIDARISENQNAAVAKAEDVTKTASSTKDEDLLSPEVKALFTRAANMILEATEADGVAFFDAKVSTFGGLVDEEFMSDSVGDASSQDKKCTMLGAASATTSRSQGVQYPMTESALRHVIRTYGYGHIFNLDEETAAAAQETIEAAGSGPSTPLTELKSLNMSRRSDSARSQDDENLLREVFPKARSLAMYPLWDVHRDRWFAGAILWTSDPMRVFTSEQELSYLAAFSNSIMAEVARLDTQLADAAKGDFISSISHETRSPLHGILGSAELLRDTRLDANQHNLMQTIETCGKTLLDTINHVLDFAKINSLTRGNSKRSKKTSHSGKQVINPGQGQISDIMSLTSDVDLSVLTEEVLETVFAGWNFQKTAMLGLGRKSAKTPTAPIAIIVDIAQSNEYVLKTQPGGWRRLLMNLFGNALKYTRAGFIRVKLEVVSRRPTVDGDNIKEVKLVVADSGIGMSRDYVNNRLFHSFVQEDPLSQGTGLGLSITKSIVENLDGEIECRSEKGKGTKFTVTCPVKASVLSPAVRAAISTESELLSHAVKRAKGMLVSFVGFEEQGDYFGTKSATLLTLKAMESLCKDWLGMETSTYGEQNAREPDLLIATESGGKWLRARNSTDSNFSLTVPVIVICQGAASAQSTSTSITIPGQIFECTSQPCGPHKLAKALVSCLDRQANKRNSQENLSDVTIQGIEDLSLKDKHLSPSTPLSPILLGNLSNQEIHRPPIKAALSAPEIGSVNTSPKKATATPERQLNCLAVDDNPINLRLLRTFIEKLGHRHSLATNGVEALHAVKDAQSGPDRFDVVLMDINMPEMDGMESTRQIRTFERDAGLPPVSIIALTGVADSEAQQEAFASGVNLFLVKPVRLAELDTVLRGVVTTRQVAEREDAEIEDAEREDAEREDAEREDAEIEDAEREDAEREGGEKEKEKENVDARAGAWAQVGRSSVAPLGPEKENVMHKKSKSSLG
ncbi:hypothetical protein EJ04DRAFT_216496 [Polyplosphaeria fusca]|uniref:Uncharacterized protein n=1 Tax=Polyplosphaeria fusca TaxID=682080 RepID=A0A9P4V3G2_9PLEO|nr:hypothetical protein EJ04DRAFT_216496 [Polyplosphaeria fusca]